MSKLFAILLGFPLLAWADFPPGPIWPDGTLVRANDAPAVYIIQNGAKRLILAPGLFSCFNRSANDIILVFSYLLNQRTPTTDPIGACTPVDTSFRSIGTFQHDFQEGSRHIATGVWTMPDGTIRGVVRWENDSMTNGVCGGALIGLLDSSGALLHYYTPPTGCLGSKPPGHAIQRFMEWSDTIPPQIRPRVVKVKVTTIFTSKEINLGDVFKTITDAAQKIGTAVAAAQ